jgi:hypothetical protein
MFPLAPTTVAVPVMVKAIQTLYGITSAVNDFINKHIEEMSRSDNDTIAQTGRVLDGVKCGFGLGYISSVIIIATGQYLLGNTLAAITTVTTAAVFTNPIAMTCAATGAIFYGWRALSNKERNEILERLSEGLDLGIALIKAVLRFLIDDMKKRFNPEALIEIKEYISDAAKAFGNTLGGVTKKVIDKIHDTIDTGKEKMDKGIDHVTEAIESAKEEISEAADKTGQALSDGYETVKEAGGKVVDGARKVLHLNPSEKDKPE